MKFKKISIENFKSIGETPVVIDLNFNNTKLLCGSNGAGKTTIIDAIIWCIYGVTKLKADNVVNKFIGSGTKVELEFSENQHDYAITRYRKHSVHKNNLYIFEDGNNITLKNPSDNQELLQKIVGIDSRAFMSSIILSSETYKQFLRETNSVRLQIFESVFSLRELNDLSKINKQRIKDLELEINNKSSEKQVINSYIEADTEALKSYKLNYENTVIRIDNNIKKLEEEISQYQRYLDSNCNIDFDKEIKKTIEYQTKLAEYETGKKTLDDLNSVLSLYSSQYDDYKNKIDEYNEIINKYNASELKEELAKINKRAEQEKEKQELEESIKESEINLKTIDLKAKEVDSRFEYYQTIINSANDKLNKIKLEICPLCGNHIDNEHSKLIIQEQQEIIKNNTIEVDKIKLEINALNKAKSDLLLKIDTLITQKDNIKFIEPKYTSDEIKDIANKLKEANSSLPGCISALDNKKSEIVKVKQKISLISIEKPESNCYSLELINDMKSKIIDFQSKIDLNKKMIESENNTKQTTFDKEYVTKIASAIKERNKNVEKINSEIFQLKKELAEYLVLDEVFSNGENGFKKYFINKTITMFNEKINTFLPFFFEDDINIQFDKDLNDNIIFRSKETDFEELSSGEKTRCELCIVFSLYFMVQSLFGCGTNLLIIDEILDRGLDNTGIIASKQILNDISKNTSVFVVTHRDDLKEMFTDIITVYKDGDGFTKIKNGV